MVAVLRNLRGLSHVAGAVKVLAEPDLYEMLLRVYLPILFPLTFLIVLLARTVDAAFGWAPVLPTPLNFVVAGALFAAGALVWVYTYATLIKVGDGSPAPVVRRTQRLVTSGIYAYCRNPSVHGKLLGFLAVGVAIGSPTFVYVLAPFILVVSLLEKVVRQEPQLIEVFGDEYLAYRDQVPLFVPLPGLYRSLRRRGLLPLSGLERLLEQRRGPSNGSA